MELWWGQSCWAKQCRPDKKPIFVKARMFSNFFENFVKMTWFRKKRFEINRSYSLEVKFFKLKSTVSTIFGTTAASFLNRFVGKIFGNLFYQTFGRIRYFSWFLTKKNSENVYFYTTKQVFETYYWLQKHWKIDALSSQNYDFAFTNLFKSQTWHPS